MNKMNVERRGISNLYALLIGIDCYLSNRLPNGSSYSSLRGCVRDIKHVEEFLQRKQGMMKENILKLTATNTGKIEPSEPQDKWPTYENIVASFQKLTDLAQPGDQVYIHYSGHGGRAMTQFPDLKGADGIDETLVPMDIGNSEGRYLRDIELAHIIQTMVNKGLIVTIVLDSCHSGGATRGINNLAIRGLSVIDTTPRITESLVSSHEELVKTWRSLIEGVTRDINLGSGWLPEPKGYILLAACRPSEYAYEYSFDGKENNGVLTYWLLDSLQQIGHGLTYKMVHDRIIAKVHSMFEQQTPMLEGDGSRIVFGSDHVQPWYAINVMQIDQAGKRVLLNTGQTQVIEEGAQFAIYPPGTIDFTKLEKRLALVEITELGATDSWAKITNRFGDQIIEQGSQAVLLDPGSVLLSRKVRLVPQANLPQEIDQNAELEEVKKAISKNGHGFVEFTDGDTADYQVAINEKDDYEIWDPAGVAFGNMHPAIKVTESNATERLVQRLVHLSKYHSIQQLDNFDSMSPLSRKLLVELARAQPGYKPGKRPEPHMFDEPSNTPTFEVGEWIFLHIKNNASQVLNVVAFDLRPDWSITQIYPGAQDTAFMPFDPGHEEWLTFQADLPSDYTVGKDIIKVIATVGAANFHWLELPPLDQPIKSVQTRGELGNALEQLFATIAADYTTTRNLKPGSYPSKEWIAAEVEVRIQREALR